jgi:hypothetical protein
MTRMMRKKFFAGEKKKRLIRHKWLQLKLRKEEEKTKSVVEKRKKSKKLSSSRKLERRLKLTDLKERKVPRKSKKEN